MKRLDQWVLTSLSLLSIFAGTFSCTELEEIKDAFGLEAANAARDLPYLILVTIDSYRPDFTERFQPKSLLEMKAAGASADNMISVFPADLWPAHYTIATGMYPETHGIVSNTFYDPGLKREFSRFKIEEMKKGSWYGGTPFWVAAEKAGIKTASFFWPGTEADIEGVHPTYYYFFDPTVTNRARVDQIKTLLDLPPAQRPHVISFAISSLDMASHKLGPDSPELKKAVLEADADLSRLFKHGRSTNLPIHYIVLSGYGMQQVNKKRIEYLEDYIDLKSLKILGVNPKFNLYSEDSKALETAYRSLSARGRFFKTYRRSEMPDRFHCSTNPRCGDLMVLAQSPYVVRTSRKDEKNPTNAYLGTHGYDPQTTPSMNGIFFAMGPSIKQGVRIPAFEEIHVYPLIMKILNLPLSNTSEANPKILEGILK